MKLQAFGIVFALICLPLILVLSYYISLQVNTIELQNQYDSKLLDATSDAMSSFELNTSNEDLSTVSDSLRTIIEASDNIFMNTLATNFGMSNASRSHLEPFIPAILHTLYDGYYIYAPSYSPTVVTDSDGNAVSVGDLGVQIQGNNGLYTFTDPKNATDYQDALDKIKMGQDSGGGYTQNKNNYEIANTLSYQDIKNHESNGYDVTDYGQLLYTTPLTQKDSNGNYTNCTTSTDVFNAEYKTKDILKTYVPYSARYVQSGLHDSEGNEFTGDINVIYTLDNYVTIEGNFKYGNSDEIYYSKSGYLLPFISTIDENDHTQKNTKLSVRVLLGDSTDENQIYNYNQNEIQQYIENGNPIKIQILNDLDGNEYEDIIDIKSSNNNTSIIDKTNTNPNSDNSIVTRYKNFVQSAEECTAKINQKIIKPEENIGVHSGKYVLDAYSNATGEVVQRNDIGNFLDLVLYADSELSQDSSLNGARSKFESFRDAGTNIHFATEADLLELINSINNTLRLKINEKEYNMQLNSSAVYYAKAAIFSKWVADNLSEINSGSIQEISGLNYTTYKELSISQSTGDKLNYLNIWKETNQNVFDFTTGTKQSGVATTEIKEDSPFYTHKLDVIRTSIQYNLNLAMSSYNRHLYYGDNDIRYQQEKNIYMDYSMPIMQQSEWEQILSNISIVSFMQGIQCGLKMYNNYVVVSSTNNEVMTSVENVYYAKTNEFNDSTSEYHKYNCKKLINNDNYFKDTSLNQNQCDKYTSFTSKEVKYDKLSSNSDVLPYIYDHKNLACYDCINDGNYDGVNIFDSSNSKFDKYRNIRKAFYIGIAKERNDVYKMNAIDKSEGYEIIYNDDLNSSYNNNLDSAISKLKIDKIKELEIVFSAVNVNRRDKDALTFAVQYNGQNLKNQPGTSNSMLYSIPTNTANYYTWKIEVDPNISGSSGNFSFGKLNFVNVNPFSVFNANDLKKSIKCIRVIYK